MMNKAFCILIFLVHRSGVYSNRTQCVPYLFPPDAGAQCDWGVPGTDGERNHHLPWPVPGQCHLSLSGTALSFLYWGVCTCVCVCVHVCVCVYCNFNKLCVPLIFILSLTHKISSIHIQQNKWVWSGNPSLHCTISFRPLNIILAVCIVCTFLYVWINPFESIDDHIDEEEEEEEDVMMMMQTSSAS